MDTNKCLILIVIIVLILILIQRVMSNKKIIDKFQSGLLTSSKEQVIINNTINDILREKMNTVKLVSSKKENAINLLDDESPLGMISFFYQNPNSEEENIWVECNGQIINSFDYPDFFDYLNTGKSDSDKDVVFTVPNIIGRTIVGSGLLKADDLEHRNTNLSYSYDGLLAYHGNDQIEFKLGERSGVDSCPLDNRIKVATSVSGDINVCSNMSNMPPHIYLIPFMKVKNRKFTLSYSV